MAGAPNAALRPHTVTDAAGAFANPGRIALHEGEIVERPVDGDLHISLTMALARVAFRALDPAQVFVGVQTTLQLSTTNAPSPDLYLLRGGAPSGPVAPERILLIVEVADPSLREDLTSNAARFARADVAEFWVADCRGRRLYVHRLPIDGRYPPPLPIDAHETAAPIALPDFAVRLDDIWPAG